MTSLDTARYSDAVTRAVRERDAVELAVGFLRYEALRKLKPRQYAELCQRNLKGERFDDMVDALVVKGVTP